MLMVQLASRIAILADIKIFALSAMIPNVSDGFPSTAITFIVLEDIVNLFLASLRRKNILFFLFRSATVGNQRSELFFVTTILGFEYILVFNSDRLDLVSCINRIKQSFYLKFDTRSD
jgi:hypothetical protein